MSMESVQCPYITLNCLRLEIFFFATTYLAMVSKGTWNGFSCKNTEKIIPFIVYTIHKILHYKREILSLYQVNLGCSDPRILIATINIHSIRYFSK